MSNARDIIVPSFDDEEHAGRKLAITCSTGSLDMAYPGLILGNAALDGVEAIIDATDFIELTARAQLLFS